MQSDKKKIFFGMMILILVIFIGIYTYLYLTDEESTNQSGNQPEVPALEESTSQFQNRKEAVDQLRPNRRKELPGIYDEELMDATGNYNPYLKEEEKQLLVDSILASGPEIQDYDEVWDEKKQDTVPSTVSLNAIPDRLLQEDFSIGSGHHDFFSGSIKIHPDTADFTRPSVRAEINGDQVIRKNSRLVIRLLEDLVAGTDTLRRNELLYANCSFRANRLLAMVHLNQSGIAPLKIYDLADRQEGLYIENSFRSQAATEMVDDLLGDINVSGLPQVSGLKNIFRKSNNSVKVQVLNQYQLLIK